MCIDEKVIREEIRQRAGVFRSDFLDMGCERQEEIHRENEEWITKTCIYEGYEPQPFLHEYRIQISYDAEG